MDERLEEELKRAPKGTKEALIRFKETGDLTQLEIFARGIIARNIDDAYKDILEKADDRTRMIDDLGIDSLSMMEIAMTFEDALGIELIDDDLKELSTLGDMKAQLLKQLAAE